jgi:chemotaxis protein MotB
MSATKGAGKGHGKAHAKGHGGGHRKKHGDHEEHENHERWLVSYADMMTLLMVLFIVLFAMSQVDKAKFNDLKNSLANGFGSPTVAFNGGDQTLLESSESDAPLDVDSGVGAAPTADEQAVKDEVSRLERMKAQSRQAAAKTEVENFEKIKKQILEALSKEGLDASVQFAVDERGLVVTVVTSSVVFDGGQAVLLPAGERILNGIGPAIAPLPNKIGVDGHTNQLNASTGIYPSGWELSTARASTVVRYLHAHTGIPENRLTAAGYADTKPLFPPSDPRSITHNRRVEIVILSTLPADARALLPSAAKITD